MTTLAGRAVLFLATLALIPALVGVAAHVWAGRWDVEKFLAVALAVPIVAFLALMLLGWE